MSEFRYDRLMEVKEKLIEHKQRQLETAMSSLQRAIDEICEVEREISDRFEDMASRCLTGNEFCALTGYLTFLDNRKLALLGEKERRDGLVTTLRAELLGIEVEMKMLEKLRSKTLQVIKKARNRKEQKVMDDLALRIESR